MTIAHSKRAGVNAEYWENLTRSYGVIATVVEDILKHLAPDVSNVRVNKREEDTKKVSCSATADMKVPPMENFGGFYHLEVQYTAQKNDEGGVFVELTNAQWTNPN